MLKVRIKGLTLFIFSQSFRVLIKLVKKILLVQVENNKT